MSVSYRTVTCGQITLLNGVEDKLKIFDPAKHLPKFAHSSALTIQHLPEQCTEARLDELLQSFSHRHRYLNSGLAFASVQFWTPLKGQDFRNVLRNYLFHGRRLGVAFAVQHIKMERSGKIVIRNIDPKFSLLEIHQMLRGFGDISQIRQITSGISGTTSQTAFVRFYRKASAQIVIQVMNKTFHALAGPGKRLYVS